MAHQTSCAIKSNVFFRFSQKDRVDLKPIHSKLHYYFAVSIRFAKLLHSIPISRSNLDFTRNLTPILCQNLSHAQANNIAWIGIKSKIDG